MAAAGTVLVIDDQPQSLEAMREALYPLGFEVWQALDGETGFLLARERQPDVILLDVMMPGIDGYEVAAVSRPTRRRGYCRSSSSRG
jgi:CheY-like chemotaxis protein